MAHKPEYYLLSSARNYADMKGVAGNCPFNKAYKFVILLIDVANINNLMAQVADLRQRVNYTNHYET